MTAGSTQSQKASVKAILVGNSAYCEVTWVPSTGLSAVTAMGLTLYEPDGTAHVVTATSTGTANQFRGSYNIPEGADPGTWVYRGETTAGPYGAFEISFEVLGTGVRGGVI